MYKQTFKFCFKTVESTCRKGKFMESDSYIKTLLDSGPIRDPVLRKIIQDIHLPAGSEGLDAGCGIGLITLMLAETVGEKGFVTGIDIIPEFLQYGEKAAARSGVSDHVTFQKCDILAGLPFSDHTLDWVWSIDCLGYLGEIASIMEELKRVVKPGGKVFVLAWTSQLILPGYPVLEARLNATSSSYIPVQQERNMESQFMRLPYWFKIAGLESIRGQTFVGEVLSPLSHGERTALQSLFEMVWGLPQPGESPEIRKEYIRLCTPGSPDYILDLPGYYAFFTYTLFQGTMPE